MWGGCLETLGQGYQLPNIRMRWEIRRHPCLTSAPICPTLFYPLEERHPAITLGTLIWRVLELGTASTEDLRADVVLVDWFFTSGHLHYLSRDLGDQAVPYNSISPLNNPGAQDSILDLGHDLCLEKNRPHCRIYGRGRRRRTDHPDHPFFPSRDHSGDPGWSRSRE